MDTNDFWPNKGTKARKGACPVVLMSLAFHSVPEAETWKDRKTKAMFLTASLPLFLVAWLSKRLHSIVEVAQTQAVNGAPKADGAPNSHYFFAAINR